MAAIQSLVTSVKNFFFKRNLRLTTDEVLNEIEPSEIVIPRIITASTDADKLKFTEAVKMIVILCVGENKIEFIAQCIYSIHMEWNRTKNLKQFFKLCHEALAIAFVYVINHVLELSSKNEECFNYCIDLILFIAQHYY